MNKLYSLITLLLICSLGNAQNLVLNSDFEQYSGCPDDVDGFDSTLFWVNPAHSFGSPDYFNQCATLSSGVNVPDNSWGFQPSHGGAAYAGIVLHAANFVWREYIEAALVSPLTANTCYHFEMYVNLGNICRNTTSDIGVYFSDTMITGIQNADPLPFIPQISNNISTIFDTLTWKLVSGDYTATGGEAYLTIGNFKDDANTNVITTDTSGIHVLYCFIDDVSLTTCTTGINEQNEVAALTIYPNPFSDKIILSINNKELSEITLCDITSRKIVHQEFTNSFSINTEQLSKGIYLYEVRNKNGVVKKGKVVKD